MAKLICCLEAKDIKTHVAGFNINIVTDLIDINFTQEAAKELIADLIAHLNFIEERDKEQK